MDYRVVLSPSARADLRNIVRYISADEPERAVRFGRFFARLFVFGTRPAAFPKFIFSQVKKNDLYSINSFSRSRAWAQKIFILAAVFASDNLLCCATT